VGCARGAETETRRLHFTDIAPKSNFAYRTDNNFTAGSISATMCGGVAAFDFDNDGRMDLFFTNGASCPNWRRPMRVSTLPAAQSRRWHVRGCHRARRSARQGPRFSFGVAAGDYDNDGYEDLFICNAGPNTLYTTTATARSLTLRSVPESPSRRMSSVSPPRGSTTTRR